MNVLKRVLTSKLFLALIGALALYTVTGFVLTPYLVRHYGPQLILEQTRKQSAIGQVRLNPFLLTLEVHDFQISETDGQRIIGFERFFCDFELASLVERAWTFSQFALHGPLINVVVARDGAINLAQLAPPSENPSASTPDKKALPRLIVREIRIDQGQIGLVDQRPSPAASMHYQQLQLLIKNFTTLPGQEGQVALSAKGDVGESIQLDGQLGLEPLAARGAIAVEGLRLSTLFQFVRDSVALVPPQGKLALKAKYRLEASADGRRVALSGLDMAVDGVVAKREGAETPFLELKTMKLVGGRLDLAKQRLEVKSLAASGARARLVVDEGGRLNVSRMFKTSAGAQAQATPTASAGVAPWKIVVGGFSFKDLLVEYRDQSRTPEPWASIGTVEAECKAEVELGQGELRGAVHDIGFQAAEVQAGLADREEPLVRIDTIGLGGGGLDLATKDFVADTVVVQGGGIDVVRQADGAINLAQLAPAPPTGEAEKKGDQKSDDTPPAHFLVKTVTVSGVEVAVADLALKPAAPKFNLHDIALTLSNVDGKSPMDFELALKVEAGGWIKSVGTISPVGPALAAKLQVQDLNLVPVQPYLSPRAAVTLKSGTISSAGSLRFGCQDSKTEGCNTYQGGLAIDALRITDEGGEETLVGWKSLQTEQLRLDLQSNALEVGDLKLTGPTGKVIIDKDRSLNLAKLMKADVSAKKPRAAKPGDAEPLTYRVRRILVNSGKVDFADYSLITPFGTKIHELKGLVTGISSQEGSRAQIKLEGRVDDYGTAKAKGEFDTAAPKTFTDLNLTFRNVEMARLTPYSGKFAGRQIKAGKLSVDLQYTINQGELAGDNKFKVERLSLGDRVDSPDAVSLPLDLAIALLEDSNGVIDLGLPVRGNLNSPEFSYGSVVGKALASLLLKIVTSPFRILGALLPGFGGDETLNAVAFEAGRVDVPPPEKEKLAKLSEALRKRPQLTLTVTGVYHPLSDKTVLQARHVSRALAKIMGQATESDDDSDAVDFGSPETEDGLVDLFKERFGAEAYKTVQAELKVEKKAEKEQAKTLAASGKLGSVDGVGEDQGRFSKLLFARLTAGERIADGEFTKLADDRAQAVIGELVAAGRTPPERVKAALVKGLDPKAAIAVELNLEASP